MIRLLGVIFQLALVICESSNETAPSTTVRINTSPVAGEPLLAPETTTQLVFIKFNGTLYPETLSKLKNLEELRFDGAQFDEIKPGSLCQSPELKTIILNSILLKELTKEHLNNCGHLKQLEIRYIDFPIESGALSQLKNLESFLTAQFSWGHLTKTNFTGLEKVKKLSLTSASIDGIEPSAFEEAKSLEELILRNNKLSVINGDEFKSLTALKTLDIDYNPLTLVNIHQLLKNLPSLKQLDVSYALQTDEDKNKIEQVILDAGLTSRYN